MEKITLTDMAYLYRMLSEVKKPSAKVKETLVKLEDEIHLLVTTMKRTTMA